MRRTLSEEDHGDDQTVNTQNTGHNKRENSSHDKVWLEHAHGTHSDTRLGGSVRSSKVYERQSQEVSAEVSFGAEPRQWDAPVLQQTPAE